MTARPDSDIAPPIRSLLDLHTHSSASFDSELLPEDLVAAVLAAGLTHVAVTDHDRIDGALRARDVAPDGLTVIVGEEMRTISGDVIGLFLERPIASGMTVAETAAAIMEQRGIVGLPHPFDGRRPSTAVGLTPEALMELSATIDFRGGP
ncbi:MAG: PHP domain-containing protein [Chloroflexi bacterium]|nr:PHP domain-containing protein [Chloroflexota bacterium]